MTKLQAVDNDSLFFEGLRGLQVSAEPHGVGGCRLFCAEIHAYEGAPAHLDASQTIALFRYLSRLVLPAVSVEQRECGGRVYTSGTSVVYASPHGISPRSQANSPEEARALAACLLAAADEAEGTVE